MNKYAANVGKLNIRRVAIFSSKTIKRTHMQTAAAYISTVGFVCPVKVLNIIRKGTT